MTLYRPGCNCGNKNAPVSVVTAIADWFVWTFVNVTVAPGSTPPDESRTVPARRPRTALRGCRTGDEQHAQQARYRRRETIADASP